MGWVTLSLRKMVLTQRVSELENRLTKLSQAQQTLANSSAYQERALGLRRQDAYKNLMSEYSGGLNNIQWGIAGGNGNMSEMMQYQVQLQQSQLDYMYNKMMIDSVFTAQEQALQDQVNDKQTYLELEQEQVETQLEAARAELEQMDEAITHTMGWAALSLRKMTLKQRINNLEQRLVNISQELQSMYDSASYAQQAMGVEQSQAMMALQNTYSNNTATIGSQYTGATNAQDLAAYQTALQQEQLSMMYNQMIQNSLFTAKGQALQETINQQETQLQLEQEQVETQLEAARAEYDSLDQACSQDIQSGAIKLTA